MTTRTQTLNDFLLARIAEDEVDAGEYWDGLGYEFAGAPTDFDDRKERALADCEAKRRIVQVCHENTEAGGAGYGGEPWMVEHVLRALALPYADHPDYREEWRP